MCVILAVGYYMRERSVFFWSFDGLYILLCIFVGFGESERVFMNMDERVEGEERWTKDKGTRKRRERI